MRITNPAYSYCSRYTKRFVDTCLMNNAGLNTAHTKEHEWMDEYIRFQYEHISFGFYCSTSALIVGAKMHFPLMKQSHIFI